MTLKHRSRKTMLAVVLSSCLIAQANAQIPCGGDCQKCLAVGCAPARYTYGYVPTQWRRWPEGPLTETPTPAKEQVAQPPAETPGSESEATGPRIETEVPETAPDESPLPTIEPEPATPAPETTPGQPTIQPETMLPFEDEPPAPPSESLMPGPAESELPGLPSSPSPSAAPGSPGLDSPLGAPPSDDAAPKMPDDDPFKDDPVAPGPEPQTSAVPAGDQQARRASRAGEKASPHGASRWRAVGASANEYAEAARLEPSESASFKLDELQTDAPAPPERDSIVATLETAQDATARRLEPTEVSGTVTRVSKDGEPLLKQPCAIDRGKRPCAALGCDSTTQSLATSDRRH